MKIDWKKIFFYISIPLALGALVGWISGNFKGFEDIVMPEFAPPK